jgi:hypothetical protein
MPNVSLRALKLVLQFRHFELCENLALMDLVSDIDAYPANVAGDLGVKIDLLIRLKLTGDYKRTCEIAADYRDDRSGPWLLGWSLSFTEEYEQRNGCDYKEGNHGDPKDSLMTH